MDRKANSNDNGILTWAHLKDFMSRITHKFYSRDIEVPNDIFIAKQSGSLDQGNQNPQLGQVTIGNERNTTDVTIYNPNIYGDTNFEIAPTINSNDLVQYIINNLGSYTVLNLTQDLNSDATDINDSSYTQYRSQSFIGRVGEVVNTAGYSGTLNIDGFDFSNSNFDGESNEITKNGSLTIKNFYNRQRYSVSFKNNNYKILENAPNWLKTTDDTINGYYGISINNICKFIKGKAVGYNIGNFRYAPENDQENFISISNEEATIDENIIIDFDNIAVDSKYAVYYKVQDLNADETGVANTYSLNSKELLSGKTGTTVNKEPKTIAGYSIKSPYNTSLTIKGNSNVTESGDSYVAEEGEISSFDFFYDVNKYTVNWRYNLGTEFFTGVSTEQCANTFVKTPEERVYLSNGKHVVNFNIDGTSYGYNQKTNKKITGETTLDITPTTEINSYNIIFKLFDENKQDYLGKYINNDAEKGISIIPEMKIANQARTFGDKKKLQSIDVTSLAYNFKCWNNGFIDIQLDTTEDIGGSINEDDITLTGVWETKELTGNVLFDNIVLSNNENGPININTIIDEANRNVSLRVVSDDTTRWGLLDETQKNASAFFTRSENLNKFITIKDTEDARVNQYCQIKFMNKESPKYINFDVANGKGKYNLTQDDIPYTINVITKKIQIAHYRAEGGIDGEITTKTYTFATDEYFSNSKFNINLNYNFGTNTKVFAYSSNKEFDLNQYTTFNMAETALAQETKFINGDEISNGIIYSDTPIIENLIIIYQNNN